MALDINLPNSSFSTTTVPLNGSNLQLTTSYNTRDERWRLSVDYLGTTVLFDEVIIPESAIYSEEKSAILGGILQCHRIGSSSEITRENFTSDFVIRFYTNEELEE